MGQTEKMKIVIVGHVDHGKSSLIGRLLYDTNSLAEDKIKEVENISQKMGKSIEFAFLLDHLQEEREQGITIDTTQTFFKTSKREYVIIDAPGHVEFIRNMVTGAAQADAAVLIVDAKEGIQEQTKRHAFILSMLGMEQIMLVINKMDLIQYQEDIFNDIVSEIKSFLESINLNVGFAIPISAVGGDNIAMKSSNMDWYTGLTVLETLDSLGIRQDDLNSPAVMPVQDIYKIDDKRIAVGRLETGILKVGDELTVLPTMQKTRIKSIEKFLDNINEVKAGDSVGVTTTDPVFMERGSVVSAAGSEIKVTDCFCASLFWMAHTDLKVGEKVTLRCATQEISCEVTEIHKKINSSTLQQITDDLSKLNELDVCQVSVQTKSPIAVSMFKELQSLGRFVIVKNNNISAGGIITGF